MSTAAVVDAAAPALDVEVEMDVESKKDGQFDIWAAIQEAKKSDGAAAAEAPPPPYVHPLLRRSSSFLSQKSLEICTESLGSETGSDGFSDGIDSLSDEELEHDDIEALLQGGGEEEQELRRDEPAIKKELAVVSYHCSVSSKSPARSFPPPLPSISRRDGPCVHMRPRRRDGRLVVHAVPAPSQNYLHCERQDGRLLLSFIETAFEEVYPDADTDAGDYFPSAADEVVDYHIPNYNTAENVKVEAAEEEMVVEEQEEEEDEEEQVEVVDRGTTVEVKVMSRQPQPQPQSGAGVKVHKSSLVINKFVVGTPVAAEAAARRGEEEEEEEEALLGARKAMGRQELLHQVRRCSLNQRPLLIWEPFCIATS